MNHHDHASHEITQYHDATPQEPTAMAWLHDRLRGRYPWVITLGVLGLIAGAIAGRLYYEPTYQSVGQIRIQPALPHIMYPTDHSSMLPMFDSFIESQASALRSRRVVDRAMQNPRWQALGRGSSEAAVRQFIGALTIDRPRRSQDIYVVFTDPDPEVPVIAVSSVIRAFEQMHGEHGVESDAHRFSVLDERQRTLRNELKTLQDRIAGTASDLGPEGVEERYMFKLKQVNDLEERLQEAAMLLADAEYALESRDDGTELDAVAIDELAAVDPQMRQYLSDRRAMEAFLFQARQRYGERHHAVVTTTERLEALEVTIARYARQAVTAMRAAPGDPEGRTGRVTLADVERYRERHNRLSQLHERASGELAELAQTRRRLNDLRDEAEVVAERLDETQYRMEQLRIESAGRGRIEVASAGDPPLGAANANRQSQLMIAGGMGGAMLGAGLIVLFTLLDPRYRTSSDLRTVPLGPRLMGVLPTLPAWSRSGQGIEQAASTAHCVHHIRTLLQLDSRDGHRCFAVTSPSPHDGKTSVTFALGLSFAASGARTLLIDADLVGAGLSRRIGSLMKARSGAGPDEPADAIDAQARALARAAGEPLDEPDTSHDMHATDDASGDAALGFPGALAGEPLDRCVSTTGIDRLWVLSTGTAVADDATRVSPESIRRILADARQRYDVVLLDTGPMAGSLEAGAAVAAVDGVVLVIARGTQKGLTRGAVDRIEAVGGRVVGTVFNRARAADMARSNYGSWSSYRTSRSSEEPVGVHADPGMFGPVARAVASNTLVTANGSERHG